MSCKVLTSTLAALLLGSVSAAQATTISGNKNDFCNTGPLDDCFVSANGLDRTEAIAKVEFQGNNSLEVNSEFVGDVELDDFEFNFTDFDDGGVPLSGTFDFTANEGAPGITAFSTKRGTSTTLFFGTEINVDGNTFTGDIGAGQGLSSLVVYDNFDGDNGTNVIPVPGSGLMLLTGLGGAAALRRRKKKA